MAETITLRTAFADYPHVRALKVRALKDGSVASERVRFDFEDVPVITRAFRRTSGESSRKKIVRRAAAKRTAKERR